MKDKNLIKEIENDWLNLFPNLEKYSQNKYYLALSPILIGIELIKIPNSGNYRPHFVCYPLWKDNLRDCLDKPIILKEFNSKKQKQVSISYNDHFNEFSSFSKEIKKQIPLEFSGDLKLKKVISVIDNYSNSSPLNASMNSYLQALLHEYKFEIALYSGNERIAKKEFEKIKKKKWDIDHFSLWGVNLDKWLEDLTSKFDADSQINILKNLDNKKLKNIKKFKIII